jgi:hypothetical protein
VPALRPGRPPKRTECFLLAPAYPTDLQALFELLAATELADTTRERLSTVLATAAGNLEKGERARAMRAVKNFAVQVADRSADEIAPAAAEALTTRALAVIEALGL